MYEVEGNVLRFEIPAEELGEFSLEEVKERARELREDGKDVEVKEEEGGLVVVYRAQGKEAEYRFSPDGVRGEVRYERPVEDAERAFESQVRLIREFWLRRREAGMRQRIVEAARRLYEERGEPPSAREIARALGYKSPRVLYGPDRFRSLKEIYEAAGIPSEPRSFPGEREEVKEEKEGSPLVPPPPEPEPELVAEPIEGYRLEARIVGNYLYKVVEVEVLGQKLQTEMRFPLKEPIEVCRRDYKVRVVPTKKGPVVEVWRRKRRR